jgi:type VI secretion system protein ImpK
MDVRPVVAELLQQMEYAGSKVQATPQQVQEVKFALVAFVDETVLSPKNNFPLREEWEKTPLQLEYFHEHLAGMKFFERLEVLLKNMANDYNVVEVYYMCLILGFKGKYNIYLLEEQLKGVIMNVEEHLRRTGQLRPNALSSHWQATDQPEVPRRAGLPLWFKIAAPLFVGTVLVIYVVLYLLLSQELTVVR